MGIDEEELKSNAIEAIDLEVMSIKALIAYSAELQSEIDRVETEISYKKEARSGAENFFK
jgi:uncharacterized small protein (DUF1192 family)